MLVGMICLGFSISLIFVPLLPEIIEAAEEKEEVVDNMELNDKASGIFNAAYALGCLIAPILGGALDQAFSFRPTCDIMACASAIYGVIFFFVSVLPYLLNRDKIDKKREYIISRSISSANLRPS